MMDVSTLAIAIHGIYTTVSATMWLVSDRAYECFTHFSGSWISAEYGLLRTYNSYGALGVLRHCGWIMLSFNIP
jgi:hypothetical protein